MALDPDVSVEEIQNRIRVRAYEIWQAEGHQHGMDHAHWLQAEREVLEEVDRSGATGPVVTPTPVQAPDTGAGADARQEELIDEAVEETFPASDPIAPKRIT
jgi:hypothetical protein